MVGIKIIHVECLSCTYGPLLSNYPPMDGFVFFILYIKVSSFTCVWIFWCYAKISIISIPIILDHLSIII
jgi:hypothetical protein